MDPTPAMDDNNDPASETRLRTRQSGIAQAMSVVDLELGTALSDALEDILRFERRQA